MWKIRGEPMKLHHIKGSTYYIDGIVNTGIYKLNERDCIIIDPGVAGTRIKRLISLLKKYDLNPKAVFITHEHVDHNGGCYELSQTYKDIEFFGSKYTAFYTENSDMLFYYLTGGQFAKLMDEDIRKSFIKEVEVKNIFEMGENEIYGKKFNIIPTPGHCRGSVAIVTDDNVSFVGDLLIAERVLEILGFMYIYNTDEHRESMEKIKEFDFDYLVNGHSRKIYEKGEILEFIQRNVDAFDDFENTIIKLFKEDKLRHEDILKRVIEHYGLKVFYTEYHYYKAVIQSMIASLMDRGILDFDVSDKTLRYFVKNP